jgi:hypothetical protein
LYAKERLQPRTRIDSDGKEFIKLEVEDAGEEGTTEVLHRLSEGEVGPSPMKWKNAKDAYMDDHFVDKDTSEGMDEVNFKYTNLSEFLCRYAFVSIYAWAINLLADRYSLSREKIGDLIYIALLCPSPLVFTGIMLFWLFTGGDFEWEKLDLVEDFAEVCSRLHLKPRGGPMSRFQAQGGEFSWPTWNK